MTQESHLPDEGRIARTVAAGLAWSLKSDRPLQQATDLILLLKTTPGWTDAEIFEVQGRLLDALHDHAIQVHADQNVVSSPSGRGLG